MAEEEPITTEEPATDSIAEAELYAALYPERAALIRRLGRLPANATFGPPDDDILEALVTANTPALAALDHASAGPRSGARSDNPGLDPAQGHVPRAA